MRLFYLGAIAPAALVAATSADARSARVDVPIQFDSSRSLGFQWISVRSDAAKTTVSGYVFRKKRIGPVWGDIHVSLIRNGQTVACRETRWGSLPPRTHALAPFSVRFNLPVTSSDSLRLIHVVREADIGSGSIGERCADMRGEAAPIVEPR